MKMPSLNKIDVTHRSMTDPGISWLTSLGYRIKIIRGRVLLVRRVSV